VAVVIARGPAGHIAGSGLDAEVATPCQAIFTVTRFPPNQGPRPNTISSASMNKQFELHN
jgi:hypothetical protein